MLKLDQRPSGIWRIRGTHYGVNVDRSARTRSKAEAQVIKKKWETEIFARVHGISINGSDDKPPLTFADAAKSWLLADGNSTIYYHFDRVMMALGHTALDDITNGYLTEQANQLFPDHKASTINRQFFALVGVILNHAVEERMTSPIRIRMKRVKKAPYTWYEPEFIENLLNEAGEMRPFLEFHVATGARPSEAVTLKWKDVGLDGRRIIFWETKGGSIRSYDLCERGRLSLPERGPDDQAVFLNGNGQPYERSPDGRFYGPKQRLDRLTKRKGLEKTSLRALRHTWATWKYSIHTDPFRLQQEGGWSTTSMVENYAHVASPDIKDRVISHGWFQ